MDKFLVPTPRFSANDSSHRVMPIAKIPLASTKIGIEGATDFREFCQQNDHAFVSNNPESKSRRKQARTDVNKQPSQRTTVRRTNAGNNVIQRKRGATLSEVYEHGNISLSHSKDQQTTLNRTEQRVVQFGPSGIPEKETTITSQWENTRNHESTNIKWEYERSQRDMKLKEIMNTPIEDCKDKSPAFAFYRKALCREISIFKRQVKLRFGSEDNLSKVWTDHDFVARFLFGLENSWSTESQLEVGEVPWLACLWTMSEMLAFCHDKYFVQRFCNHRFHINEYGTDMSVYPQQLFCINKQMISGFVTGQLYCSAIPTLKELMRPTVSNELGTDYFPQFDSFVLDDHFPASLEFTYDFYLVPFEDGVPTQIAFYCEPKGICFLLGSSFETVDDRFHSIETDPYFVQIMSDASLKRKAMNAVSKIAFENPNNTFANELSAIMYNP